MTATIPEWIERARAPGKVVEAADYLAGVDDLHAIEPLARLSRRAPGWLVMGSGFLTTQLVALAALGASMAVVAGGLWLLVMVINAFLVRFYAGQAGVWWLGWLLLVSLWTWRDGRLRGLLIDERYALPRATFTLAGAIWLWPFRALAGAQRLLAALWFLTWMLALPLTGAAASLQTWVAWRSAESTSPHDLTALGFAAGAIYLLFGLFVFSDWPRDQRHAHSFTRRQKLWRLGAAILGAAVCGGLIYAVNREAPAAVATGLFLFWLFAWFLANRSPTSPWDLNWLGPAARKIRLAERQLRFLKFTLLLLALLGAGAVWVKLAQAWPQLAGSLPGASRVWLTRFAIAGLNIAPLAYPAAEGWVAGAVVAAGCLAVAGWAAIGGHLALARPLAWPFFWMRGSVANLVARLRARLAVDRAVRCHVQRNRKQVNGQGRLAVCQAHLARFEPRHARLAYGGQLPYWGCRVCHSDAQVFTRVRLMRGVFDGGMVEPVSQAGEVLRVNLLHRGNGHVPTLPLDLQEVVVTGPADRHDIEAFIVAYQSATVPVKLPTLSSLPLRLDGGAALEENTERMLRKTFGA